MSRAPALPTETTWADAVAYFMAWESEQTPDVDPSAPAEIRSLTARIEAWDASLDDGLARFTKLRISNRLTVAGELIAEGIRLRAELDTLTVTEWRQHPDTSPTDVQALRDRQIKLGDGLEQLAIVGANAFTNAEFFLPSQVGNRAWYRNTKIVAQLLGGRNIGPLELGIPGIAIGLGRIILQERELVVTGIGRQLRAGRVFGTANRMRVDRVNRRARRKNPTTTMRRLDYERGEHLRTAITSLRDAGASKKRTKHLVDLALSYGDKSAGKAWRGLINLRELIDFAGLDPNHPAFERELEEAVIGGIHYTYTPGKEWIVRDFEIARALLKADGKTSRESESVAISQSGASIAPGVLANHPALLGLAAHYMLPIQVYLNGVVAQSGDEHRRHKNVFAGFFRKGEVLERGAFIERTVSSILDDVSLQAAKNGGRFDLKKDVAFNFPIRIICDFIGIPEDHAAQVQHWAEDAVRALDAGAGLSLSHLTEGNRSAGAFLDYLTHNLERARDGEEIPGIIGDVANNTELNDLELVSNIAGITFAGFETTTGLLSLGFLELLQHREQVDFLRSHLVAARTPGLAVGTFAEVTDPDLRWFVWANDERKGRVGTDARKQRLLELQEHLASSPALTARLDALRTQERVLGNAVEEMLRWTAPGSVIPLTLEEEFELESPIDTMVHDCPVMAGEPIRFGKGQTITVDIAAANRLGCPFGAGQFEAEPGDFDVSRTDNTSHLSFGVTHICMGADLAVENAKRMIEALLRRMPDLALDGQPDELDGNLFIGLQTLPVKSEVLGTTHSSGT